jgi:hypothetical protein
MFAKRAIRKNENRQAQNKVAERGLELTSKCCDKRNNIGTVTGGARRGVCGWLRAKPRSVNDKIKSLEKGYSKFENRCNNLTPLR